MSKLEKVSIELKLGDQAAVAEVVGERDVGVGDEGLVVVDADLGADVLDEQLEAAVLLLVGVVDASP